MKKTFALQEILNRLRDGKPLVLEVRTNFEKNEVPEKILRMSGGQWIRERLDCIFSLMGTCRCTTHQRYFSIVIPRAEGMAEIRAYIERRRREEISHAATEFVRLDQGDQEAEAITA